MKIKDALFKGICIDIILGFSLLVLKVNNAVSCSWFYILMPFWIPAVVIVGIVVVCLLVAYGTYRKERLK